MTLYCQCESPVFDPAYDAGCRRCGLPIDFSPRVCVGTVFDTRYESGCVATTCPDDDGNFLALDSDRVECHYSLAMVERITGKGK